MARHIRTICSLAAALLLSQTPPTAAPTAAPTADQDPGAPAARDAAPARQAERPGRTGLPLPRFVSLRASEVNLRTGPGVRYPIDWVYRRRDLPVEIIDEHETWRRIRDWEGTIGWVHQSMLQGARKVMVTGELRVLRRAPERAADPIARIEPGVIARLEACDEGWCEISIDGLSGWLERHEFYGVYPREEVE